MNGKICLKQIYHKLIITWIYILQWGRTRDTEEEWKENTFYSYSTGHLYQQGVFKLTTVFYRTFQLTVNSKQYKYIFPTSSLLLLQNDVSTQIIVNINEKNTDVFIYALDKTFKKYTNYQ